MSHRRIAHTSTACWIVLLAGFVLLAGLGRPARADYGVTTKRPLSSPRKAKIDAKVVGTWRTVIRGKTYYLHIGAGNIVGKLDWTELILINPGEKKPSFYVHHLIGFPSTVGGKNYFNVAHMSRLIPQLRGSKIDKLISAVDRYEIMKYEVNGDYLDIWAADQKLIRDAIQAGKIQGSAGRTDDSAESLIAFIKSTPKLFTTKFRYTRLKDPASGTTTASEKTTSSPKPSKTVASPKPRAKT